MKEIYSNRGWKGGEIMKLYKEMPIGDVDKIRSFEDEEELLDHAMANE